MTLHTLEWIFISSMIVLCVVAFLFCYRIAMVASKKGDRAQRVDKLSEVIIVLGLTYAVCLCLFGIIFLTGNSSYHRSEIANDLELNPDISKVVSVDQEYLRVRFLSVSSESCSAKIERAGKYWVIRKSTLKCTNIPKYLPKK